MFTFVVWKWKARCLGFHFCFLNLWPKLSDYVVTGRIVVILTRFPYLALGTELGWFIYNQWTLGLKLSVRIFANKLCSQLIFNQSGVLPLASQPARWERTRCRLCSLRSLPPPPSLSPWRRGTQRCRCIVQAISPLCWSSSAPPWSDSPDLLSPSSPRQLSHCYQT